jgi:hypothetical protein
MAYQVTFKRLISYPNLELAWRRITTGINHQHKRYFRQLYYTYELALNANLRDLHQRNLPGAVKIVGGGKSINFGTLVDAQQPFARQYPSIAAAFRDVNSRRNTLPFSHPYEVKGGARTRHLKKSEQAALVQKLSTAYTEIMKHFGPLVT